MLPEERKSKVDRKLQQAAELLWDVRILCCDTMFSEKFWEKLVKAEGRVYTLTNLVKEEGN